MRRNITKYREGLALAAVKGVIRLIKIFSYQLLNKQKTLLLAKLSAAVANPYQAIFANSHSFAIHFTRSQTIAKIYTFFASLGREFGWWKQINYRREKMMMKAAIDFVS